MKIIFLDIDGVLNCEDGYREGLCEYVGGHQSFYPPSKDLINLLIEETGAKIVISSSWRKDGLDRMKEIWKAEGMSGEVIDTTPSLYLQKNGSIHFWNGHESKHPTPKIRGYSIPRGCEIEHYLKYDLKFFYLFPLVHFDQNIYFRTQYEIKVSCIFLQQ